MTRRQTLCPGFLQRPWEWVKRSEPVYPLWLGRHCVAVAWLGLLVAVMSPPHGYALPVCWLHAATGLLCPGCGMTRSLSCAVRGLFGASWQYHPMGMPVLALFLFTAFQSLLPKPLRDRLARRMECRAAIFKSLYLAFVAVFVMFGIVRALSTAPFPHAKSPRSPSNFTFQTGPRAANVNRSLAPYGAADTLAQVRRHTL